MTNKNEGIAALTEGDIIRIMREEWDAKIESIVNELDELELMRKDSSGADSVTVSPGLKLRHTESGLLYTVEELSMRDVVLKTPEGETFTVNHETLEKEYSLD